jgi:hypothetical protein
MLQRILDYTDFSKEFNLTSDAWNWGVGGERGSFVTNIMNVKDRVPHYWCDASN